ncbi:MAG: hypothetical protein A2887_06110 [Alphaproteobacteria bacterium RIFCSPLOWO2_01_FULL_40_26]|nr:MAG: hypothetical protein A2887_06110 [Alphaproteobacteria bacterium RIFCSPLOWO2_01_FULL_40_26]
MLKSGVKKDFRQVLIHEIDNVFTLYLLCKNNSRACFQTQRVSILSKFCATFWQNFAAVSGIQQKILPKNEPKFGQKRNVVGLKTGSKVSKSYEKENKTRCL